MPFIYIAALVRTGSTLLSELLTEIPYAYIFHEPHIGKNYFALQRIDAEVFRSHDVDIDSFLRWRLPIAFLLRRLRFLGFPQDYLVKEFKNRLQPAILEVVSQVGVKEIRHTGWENYARHYEKMKVIMTGRDPRDIYLSLSKIRSQGNLKWTRGRLRSPKPFNPSTVAEELNREFNLQREIIQNSDHFLLRYEDLCIDPDQIQEVKRFTGSTLPEIGTIGAFTSNHPKKSVETKLHGGRITSKQIFSWKNISDSKLLDDLNALADLMEEYRDFWAYD